MSSSLSIQTKNSYITVLSTDNYLEGVIVLYYSLIQTQTQYPFLVLTTPNLADETYQALDQHKIPHQPIPPISLNTKVSERQKRWQWTYSKLQIFNQTQFEKLVYLDADMLICQNIDELFTKPHMSAVSAGGMLPENGWKQLNSGLMVIEPSESLYQDMMSRLEELYQPWGGDQDFLHAYYPDWTERTDLHLDHGYNLFHTHLDRYSQLFDYQLEGGQRPVKVIHFIGEYKPWLIKGEIVRDQSSFRQVTVLNLQDAVKLLIRLLRKLSPQLIQKRLPLATGTKLKRKALQAWLNCYNALQGGIPEKA